MAQQKNGREWAASMIGGLIGLIVGYLLGKQAGNAPIWAVAGMMIGSGAGFGGAKTSGSGRR